MPTIVPAEPRTRGRATARSSPLLGDDAIVVAHQTLAREGQHMSSAAGHASTDAAEDAATSTPTVPHVAVPPAVAQQQGTSSSSTGSGSPAPEQTRSADIASPPLVAEAQTSQQQGSQGLAARTPRSDGQAQEGLRGDSFAAMTLPSANSSPAHNLSGRGGGVGGTPMQRIQNGLPADTAPSTLHEFRLIARYVEDLRQQLALQRAGMIHAQDSAADARGHCAAIEGDMSALTDTLARDLHYVQNRLDQAEARANEWAARAKESDARAEAAMQRMAAVEARLSRGEAHSEAMARDVTRLTARVAILESDAANAPPPTSQRQHLYAPTPGVGAALGGTNVNGSGSDAPLRTTVSAQGAPATDMAVAEQQPWTPTLAVVAAWQQQPQALLMVAAAQQHHPQAAEALEPLPIAAAAQQQQPSLSPHAGSELSPHAQPFAVAPSAASAQRARRRRNAHDRDPNAAGSPVETSYSSAPAAP